MQTSSRTAKSSKTRSNGSKTNGANAASQRPARQATVSPYANAMDQMLPQQEVIRLGVVECLRELTGRRLQSQFRAEQRLFDWTEFNTQFRADYRALSMKALMAFAREKFGIESLEDIRELRARHKEIRSDRIKALGGTTYAPQSDSDEPEPEYYVDLDDDEFDDE